MSPSYPGSIQPTSDQAATNGYRHAAFLYAGEATFLDGTVRFIQAGLDAEEPTFVVLPRHKIALLREALGEQDSSAVQFADMQQVGSNPARIIPAWQRFVEMHPGRRSRGIGEPIFPERTEAELRECQHHERLLNPALERSDLYLLCPYDTDAMDTDVIEEAERSHPIISDGKTELMSDAFLGDHATVGMLYEPLPDPPNSAATLHEIGVDELGMARAFVRAEAARANLPLSRRMDLVLAVNEIVSNSIRHGQRAAAVSMWRERDAVIAEVRGGGHIDDALVDRIPARPSDPGHRGLWLANQVCDLVQLRSLGGGVVARMYIRVP